MSTEKMRYTRPRGGLVEADASPRTGMTRHPGGHPLRTRDLQLDAGQPVLQIAAVGGDDASYELVDNEILAGLKLAQLADPDRYPHEVSRLVGYSADGAEPYALVEQYRGVPVTEIAGKLLTDDRLRFQVSLLTGLRWLQMAGIAHRGISPYTVRWDEKARTAQITDFALATIFGAPRQAAGTVPWAAPEQRAGRAAGQVTDRDDIWAAGRLIFYVITGDEPADRTAILAEPELAQLLDGVFSPPEDRPACRDLLVGRLGSRDPVPPAPAEDPVLAQGRAEFWAYHNRRHGIAPPAAPAASAARAQGRPWKRLAAVGVSLVGVVVLATVLIRLVAG